MDPKITANEESDKQVTSSRKRDGIVESLAIPEATDIEFEPPRLLDELLTLPEPS